MIVSFYSLFHLPAVIDSLTSEGGGGEGGGKGGGGVGGERGEGGKGGGGGLEDPRLVAHLLPDRSEGSSMCRTEASLTVARAPNHDQTH